jgi:hypothetical protein
MIADSRHLPSRDVVRRMEDFAKIWQECSLRPNPSQRTAQLWDELLQTWIRSQLPIYVNKPGQNRGAVFQHRSGQLVVPCDDSPARWAFELAVGFRCPSLKEVEHLQREDRIPVARDFGQAECRRALYRCRDKSKLNESGWRLCHIKQVGIDERTALDMPLEELHRHFRLFMSPSNMYVVPASFP